MSINKLCKRAGLSITEFWQMFDSVLKRNAPTVQGYKVLWELPGSMRLNKLSWIAKMGYAVVGVAGKCWVAREVSI